ncbi:MAG: dihydroorotate dehydrogenase [candidate division Zixibacteria bacterium]|nr:dihydroorotate dehydrogenase [candidate division Zixibacteria bacterium]
MKPSLSLTIGGVTFKNPVTVASGTFGYAEEFAELIDLEALGGIVTKSITLKERQGHPPPRTCETPAGMLNAIGLANVGVERFIDEKLPFLRKLNTVRIVNVAGSTQAEYVEVCRLLEKAEGIDMLEINLSCPNVDAGGMELGTDPAVMIRVLTAVREVTSRPIIVKLSPNVTSIVTIARAAQEGGAAAVSLINTLVGMAIDTETWRPRLSNGTGGLSGPAIRPVAVAMVYKVARAIDLPVIGIGGISNWTDAVEFHLAGATAIQVGTANFIAPDTTMNIIAGLSRYLAAHKLTAITDIIGRVKVKL